jgi:phospholipid/cholesterol/gamma-HCH transport system ATP-binding protein
MMDAPSFPLEDAHIVFVDVELAFRGRPVLRGLSCSFPRGRISVILGGSGSGKTTVLRLIGGLVRPQRGRIFVAGREIDRLSESRMYEVRDKLGMMFQGGALLNSLTVFDNLAFPLREHTAMSESEIAHEVRGQLAAVGLSDVDGLLPGELSGGMLKRVALARAILTKPEILLCDEPFSGLDPVSVKRIESLLREINEERGITLLVSSHHIPSTLRLADQILLLHDGRATAGSPGELRCSADPQVSGFFNEEPERTVVNGANG